MALDREMQSKSPAANADKPWFIGSSTAKWHLDRQRERKFADCVAIFSFADEEAQLRWFLVDPDHRRRAAGRSRHRKPDDARQLRGGPQRLR
jgi:hypothetical protein